MVMAPRYRLRPTEPNNISYNITCSPGCLIIIGIIVLILLGAIHV